MQELFGMGERLSRIKKKSQSLSFRLPLTYMISGLLIVLMVIPISYFWFRKQMINDYTRIAQGMTSLIARQLDGNKVTEYLEKNRELEEYDVLRRGFQELKESYPDVLYAYVLRFEEAGGRVIFNMQDAGAKAVGAPGMVIELQPPYLKYLKNLIQGEELSVSTGKTEEGRLLTYFRPVLDDQGRCQCHVCVTFSMDKVYENNITVLAAMLAFFGLVVAGVLMIDAWIVRKGVTEPLQKMSDCAHDFTYVTESDRFQNVQKMEELNLHTASEIEELYYEFMSVMKESLYYMTNLSRAKSNIQEQEEKLDQISETAYKDALTRVGNQAAYNKLIDVLTQEIADQTAKFAIVMVDLNNLKYVNDKYGHKYGDGYIKGCCNIICNIYKRSPVFRVGGDEFVVVLRNEDYMSRLLRMTQITEAFMGAYGKLDKDPWERYSASVGMAEFTENDSSVDQVVKRADQAMYENKEKFKAKYGSYR